ncbi:helix-turn-helix domain-containing protein [Caldimonas brevitalea]|uniref:Cytoskeleton protein RodZ n=1 Tax=Caldimonas brevitalea TaxID=413882 RepID=A0A0G3BHR3_9BURK|nr:helix-turn-helix domain-containing protein [Caldimonas brevitalea]AKJ28979.1 cytoskeleton protein RodZ [Caldimonas brevitalea]
MTEPDRTSATGGQSAGEMLKAARLANGIHIAALAASIKVSVQKLEALEADRHEELPDPTFARALAQAVCRFLKVDPVPVLAKLPTPGTPSRLEHVAMGLNQPFRDGDSRRREGFKPAALLRPAFLLPLLLVVAAIVLWLLPQGLLRLPGVDTTTADTTAGVDGASTPGTTTVTVPVMPPGEGAASETVHSAPLVVDPGASAPASAPDPGVPLVSASQALVNVPSTAPVVVNVTSDSWVDARDAAGKVLVSRLARKGEILTLDGTFPMRVRLGNARGVELTVRGAPFDIGPHARDNVATLQIK